MISDDASSIMFWLHRDVPMKHTLSLLVLGLILVPPFILRDLQPWYEPYPAILFPVGSEKLSLQRENFLISRLELIAVNSDGQERPLDPAEFFSPIPVHFWPYIASNSQRFGLASPGPDDRKTKRLGSWELTMINRRTVTKRQQAEVANWLAARLRAVGLPDIRTILVRRTQVTIDIVSGKPIDAVNTYEYQVELDDYNL